MMPPHDNGLQNCDLSPHALSGPIVSSRIPYFPFNSSPSSDTKTLKLILRLLRWICPILKRKTFLHIYTPRGQQRRSFSSELTSHWQIVFNFGFEPSSPSSSPIPLPSLRSPTCLGGEKEQGRHDDKQRVSKYALAAVNRAGLVAFHSVAAFDDLSYILVRYVRTPERHEEKRHRTGAAHPQHYCSAGGVRQASGRCPKTDGDAR
ncbi:hypothetical protein BLNAU_17387 [Blattamonas nauphoetae]|uniref:Uncharacterized protein n=1 Tax=Blattamonas nauphoetae TaxID=2049346 RepID=A0ABQ9XBN5_9EUKA|nr:hypothetical protein BLNAU_17387 [Blattamonas nauphoetae]